MPHVTLIQMGDLHGHLVPRPNLRGDGRGGLRVGCFRYGTHVTPGPVRLEDHYHYLPVGAQLATTTMTGQALLDALEAGAHGTFSPDPREWTGGWVHTDLHEAKESGR